MSTAKDELTCLIQKQPEDSSREEIVRELAFHVMLERGIDDSDARRTISKSGNGSPHPVVAEIGRADGVQFWLNPPRRAL